jgi:hypothetical protein
VNRKQGRLGASGGYRQRQLNPASWRLGAGGEGGEERHHDAGDPSVGGGEVGAHH